MKGRHPLLLLAALGLMTSMACTFSSKISTPEPPQPTAEAPLPSSAPQRPQSSFIDSRTQSDNSNDSRPADTSNTANVNSSLDNGGSGGVQSAAQGGGAQQVLYQTQYVAQQQALAPVPVAAYYAPTNIYSVPVGCAPRYDW